MSEPRIGRRNIRPAISIETQRNRQTPRRSRPFKQVLRAGADVLLAGVGAVGSVVGGPAFSAAISRVRPGPNVPAPLLSSTQAQDPATALHQQQVSDDLKLLAIQSKIQQHNRQVAMLSNVMKSQHDTAKAAISNMRA